MSDYTATLEKIREIAARLYCDCYAPDVMEYGPNYPCPRCQLINAVDQLLDKVEVSCDAGT